MNAPDHDPIFLPHLVFGFLPAGFGAVCCSFHNEFARRTFK